jgi:iron complex transport system ATP-binding protein
MTAQAKGGGSHMQALETQKLTLAYGDTLVIDSLDLMIPRGKVTVLVGRNGSGKSTLLRSLARLLRPSQGSIILDGLDISRQPTRELARKLAILPQGPVTPEGITVVELVKQGRYPHQHWLQNWSGQDERKVRWALEKTQLLSLADRPVDSLSGGQRQRAWIAMVLAQDTETILFDEPTTFLDMNHQVEVLDLLYELNTREHRTIVMVLHDLNLACRYAHHMVVLHDRAVWAQGQPEDIINPGLVRTVFGIECHVAFDPLYGTPLCIPYGKGRRVERLLPCSG